MTTTTNPRRVPAQPTLATNAIPAKKALDVYAFLPGSPSEDKAVNIHMGMPTGSVNKTTGIRNNTTKMQNSTTIAINGSNNTNRNNNKTSISTLGLTSHLLYPCINRLTRKHQTDVGGV